VALVDRESRQLSLAFIRNIGVPCLTLPIPQVMLRDPIGQSIAANRILVDQIGTVVAKAEGPWIDELMNRTKPGEEQKDVLLNLCKVWCLVQQDNPVKMTCVKRGLFNGLEPVSYVSRDHRWVATTSLLFEFSYNVTVYFKPWVSIPIEWLS
jgi:hypothetical protein